MYKRKGAPNNQLSVIKTNYNSQNWRFDLYSNNKMERHAESRRRPRRRVWSRTAENQLIIHQNKSDNEAGKYFNT